MPHVSEDQARQEIQRYKANRKRSGRHDGHNRKIASFLLPKMQRGKTYTNDELGVILITQSQGKLKYSSIGPATTYMVRERMIERVGRGEYRRI